MSIKNQFETSLGTDLLENADKKIGLDNFHDSEKKSFENLLNRMDKKEKKMGMGIKNKLLVFSFITHLAFLSLVETAGAGVTLVLKDHSFKLNRGLETPEEVDEEITEIKELSDEEFQRRNIVFENTANEFPPETAFNLPENIKEEKKDIINKLKKIKESMVNLSASE